MKMKEQKGITLIALVVTIVILLILAGITITIIFNDSGIINKAREAAESVDKSHTDTEKELANLTQELGEALGEATPIAKAIEKGEDFAKDGNKQVKDENGDILTIPQGYTIVTQEMDDTVDYGKDENNEENKYPTVKAGIVITDSVDETTKKSNGNQFVWVPVPKPEEMYGIDKDGNYSGKLYDFSWSDSATDGNKLKATEKIGTGTGPEYREPDILDNNEYDKSVDNLKKVLDEYNNDEQSQGSTTPTVSEFKTQLQNEFNAMIESVKKYEGFYVGRYETSLDEVTKKVQSQANKTSFYNDSEDHNWWGQYKYNKEFAPKSDNSLSVVSSTIWGSQYDAMMKWMGSNGIDVTKGDDSTNPKRNTTRVTGSISYPNDKLCNIYDLLGNSCEWTMEAYGTFFRIARGGYYKTRNSLGGRASGDAILTKSANSSRLSLYVK